MMKKFSPTQIEALNRHLNEVIAPPWKPRLWFKIERVESLFTEMAQLVQENEEIRIFLVNNYDESTLTLELRLVELLLKEFPEPSSKVTYLMTAAILVLAFLVEQEFIPRLVLDLGILSGSIIALSNFIRCQILIYNRIKLRRAILILQFCLKTIKSR